MRKYYQRRLPEDPSKDYYFIQRLTGKTQPVLIEYGFIDNVKDLNKLKNNLLDYGEAVVRAVANYTGTKYTPPVTDENTYIVQRGDTLYSIANKYGVTIAELKRANNLTSNFLNIGQQLTIPSNTPPESNEYVTYIVEKGDNLYSIANEFDVTVDDIVKYNNLNSNILSIGQKLLIPIDEKIDEKPTGNQYYTVQRNDSLYSIARKFNTTIDELIKLNNLTTTVLQIGDKLLVSGEPSNIEVPSGDNTYTVKAGDSLYSIAKRYNTTADELKRINNLSSNMLSIGQVLLLPSNNGNNETTNYITYYVQRGDNLYNLAREYNTTVNEIKKLNNLTSDLLSIGQSLLLPA